SLAWVFGSGSPNDQPIVAWMNQRAPALGSGALVAPSRPPPDGAIHCAEYLLETVRPLGLATDLDASPLRVEPLESDDILVHPGSGSAKKNWPAARFVATIEDLQKAGRTVRLIVGEADGAAASGIENALRRPPGKLERAPLEELAARLAG